MDVAVSRLDVAINDIYLRSFPLRATDLTWPLSWVQRQFVSSEVDEAQIALPSYMLYGQNELQLRFDMRPLHRGDCIAVPGDIRASVDPDSTIDLTGAYRFATLPNLAYFAELGLPLHEVRRPLGDGGGAAGAAEPAGAGSLLHDDGPHCRAGRLPAGEHAGDTSRRPPGERRQGPHRDRHARPPARAADTLLRDAGPLQAEGNRLTVRLNDGMGDFRNLFGGERRGELERVSALLAAPGESLGALIGFESPLKSGRSVVALTGSSPAGLESMVIALRDPEQVPRVQGDLAVLSGGRVSAFRVTSTYQVGQLPPWLWPEFYLGNNPWYLLGILLVVLILVPAPLYWILRRRAAQRLRERSA
jgi:hypothetical protein